MVDDAVTHVGGFHGPQVCGLVGISYRQLDYWARTGLVDPEHEATGSGSHRRCPSANLRRRYHRLGRPSLGIGG